MLKYAGHLVFHNYIKICRLSSFSDLLTSKNPFNKICLYLVFSESLTGRNSVLLKYAGHLAFWKC